MMPVALRRPAQCLLHSSGIFPIYFYSTNFCFFSFFLRFPVSWLSLSRLFVYDFSSGQAKYFLQVSVHTGFVFKQGRFDAIQKSFS